MVSEAMKKQHERTQSKANADLADELNIGSTIQGFKERALREERALKQQSAPRTSVPKLDTMATTFGKERDEQEVHARVPVAEVKVS